MSNSLTSRQIIPLTDEEREDLAAAAVKHNLSNGLFARALMMHSLDLLDTADVQARLKVERTATKKRISDGARTAIRARWGAEGDDH